MPAPWVACWFHFHLFGVWFGLALALVLVLRIEPRASCKLRLLFATVQLAMPSTPPSPDELTEANTQHHKFYECVYLNPPPSRQTIPITPESSASAPAGQAPPQNISTVDHRTFFSTVDYSTIDWVCIFLNYAMGSDSRGAVGLSLHSL